MEKVVLYWSNICVLHKQEMKHIEAAQEKLKQQGIDLAVHYFGLGYPYRLSQYLRENKDKWPDLLVSTDLEVFEDSRLFAELAPDLYELTANFPLKEHFAQTAIQCHPGLIPFAVIPLIFYGAANQQQALMDIIAEQKTIAFGGIHNSAAPCVLKAVWSQFGLAAAQKLRDQASITNMPIQAFQKARLRQTELAIVPSLYAARADGLDYFAAVPAEGAVALPSYACARKTIARETALKVLTQLFTPEFCQFLVRSGDVLCPLTGAPAHPKLESVNLLYPSRRWLQETTPEEFAAFYAPVLEPITRQKIVQNA